MDILERFEIFLPAALLMILIVAVSSLAASIILPTFNHLKFSSYKRRMSSMYKIFYMTDTDVVKDEMSSKMIPIIGRGYGNEMEKYMSAISEDRLPICIVMNWVRSIAEDISEAPLPVLRIEKWHSLMIKSGKSASMFTHIDFIEFEKYEITFIWGCVYRWLEIYSNNLLTKELSNEIIHYAYPKKYLKPYFDICQTSQIANFETMSSALNNSNVDTKIEVHGDLVMNKHVDSEVNSVASGATGINVSKI